MRANRVSVLLAQQSEHLLSRNNSFLPRKLQRLSINYLFSRCKSEANKEKSDKRRWKLEVSKEKPGKIRGKSEANKEKSDKYSKNRGKSEVSKEKPDKYNKNRGKSEVSKEKSDKYREQNMPQEQLLLSLQ
jgi:hypothetical protein